MIHLWSLFYLVRQIEFYIQLFTLLDVLFLYFLAHMAYLWGFTIVQEAVWEHQLHIFQELSHAFVEMFLQIIFYGTKVHWLLDYFQVISDTKLLWVYWIEEYPCFMLSREYRNHPSCYFFPMIINRNWFIHLWNMHFLYFWIIIEIFS